MAKKGLWCGHAAFAANNTGTQGYRSVSCAKPLVCTPPNLGRAAPPCRPRRMGSICHNCQAAEPDAVRHRLGHHQAQCFCYAVSQNGRGPRNPPQGPKTTISLSRDSTHGGWGLYQGQQPQRCLLVQTTGPTDPPAIKRNQGESPHFARIGQSQKAQETATAKFTAKCQAFDAQIASLQAQKDSLVQAHQNQAQLWADTEAQFQQSLKTLDENKDAEIGPQPQAAQGPTPPPSLSQTCFSNKSMPNGIRLLPTHLSSRWVQTTWPRCSSWFTRFYKQDLLIPSQCQYLSKLQHHTKQALHQHQHSHFT